MPDANFEDTLCWSSEADSAEAWPEPDPAMFHGLPGEIVGAIEPHTEADSMALLVQVLTAFGNVIGKGSFFEVEAARHYANIFPVLVGDTSKGRKGTSWGHIERIFRTIAPTWGDERIQTGLSSGEGLIFAIRDEVKKGDTVVDEGVTDKRLLIIEPEFASVLKVTAREGNTLSALLRQSWDSGNLRTLTKNSPLKALNSHISLISHITKDELLRYLTTTETGNGFANRFLWVTVRRSKCLPRGGEIHRVNFNLILKKLTESIDFAKEAGRIEPTEEAWKIWEEIYPELSEGRPGLLGAVTSRAEAQTMRLAMIYALMDKSRHIKSEHLLAALALWDFCFHSAKSIFRDNLGNTTADEILNALLNNPKGLYRSDIVNLFNRHKKTGEISQALMLLQKKGLAIKDEIQTRGRRAELWTARKER